MCGRDTIYALSSGFGTVALSVIRVSGDRSSMVLETLAGDVGVARRSELRVLRDPVTLSLIHI